MTSDIARLLLDLHARVPAFSLANVIETLTLVEGEKPALRLLLDGPDIESVAAALNKCGLHGVAASARLRLVAATDLGDRYLEPTREDDPSARVEMMFARDQKVAERCAAAQDSGKGLGDLGALLGYPPCCVAAQEQQDESVPDWVKMLLTASPLAADYPHGANRFAYLFSERTLGFELYPCSLTCPGVVRIADATRRALERHGLTSLAEEAEAEMKQPILVRRGVLVRPREWHRGTDSEVCLLKGAQVRGWKVQPGVEADPAWDCDRVERHDGRLRFYDESTLRLDVPEDRLDNRLLVFR